MKVRNKESFLKTFSNVALIGYPIFLLLNSIHYGIFARKKYKKGLSGILRVYNEINHLELSINSCIDALDELICYDNGSTDGTYEKLLELAKTNPKIKVFQYTNREGWYIKKLCNKSLSKTTYRYVVKIDADQIYNVNYLNELKHMIGDKPNKIYLMSGLNIFRNKDNELVFPHVIREDYKRLINGLLDHIVFKKSIITRFYKHKIEDGKYEFLYIPFMGSIARPFTYYSHLVWLHLRYLSKNSVVLDKYTKIEEFKNIEQSFFSTKEQSYFNYLCNFAINKTENGYEFNKNVLNDIFYWYQYAIKNIK